MTRFLFQRLPILQGLHTPDVDACDIPLSDLIVPLIPGLFFCRCELYISTVVFMPQFQTHAERHTSREAARNACREDIASSDINVAQLYLLVMRRGFIVNDAFSSFFVSSDDTSIKTDESQVEYAPHAYL